MPRHANQLWYIIVKLSLLFFNAIQLSDRNYHANWWHHPFHRPPTPKFRTGIFLLLLLLHQKVLIPGLRGLPVQSKRIWLIPRIVPKLDVFHGSRKFMSAKFSEVTGSRKFMVEKFSSIAFLRKFMFAKCKTFAKKLVRESFYR